MSDITIQDPTVADVDSTSMQIDLISASKILYDGIMDLVEEAREKNFSHSQFEDELGRLILG